jgi:NADH:ubiquinone oxidoreductase subunit 6 (subunit J)
MNDLTKHLVSSLVFVAALIFLWNPLGTWMPSAFEMVFAGAVAVIAAVFIGLVSTDEGRDEREVAMRGKSARVGYMTGVLVLSLCVVVGLVTHEPANLWILGALAAMILARVIHRVL